MSITFTNDIEGVKARDYSVFIREAEYELDGVMVDCPPIPALTKQVDLNFLTGFDLEIYRTITVGTEGTLTTDDLNKAINIPRNNTSVTISFLDTPEPNKYFMLNVYDGGSGIGSSILTLELNSDTFVLNGLGYFKFLHNGINWLIYQVGFHAIGEMTKDSINPKIENGLTVESNLNDTIILDKTATFSFNLANLVVDNIAQMEALDKKKVEFLLLSSDKKQLYVFKPMIFNYSEDFKSGQVSTLPITLTKKIINVEDFREVQDVSSLT